MPELPEIETFRRRFLWGSEEEPSLVGARIVGAELLWARTLAEPEPDEFLRRVAGQTITDVGRRGKFLLLYLSSDVLAIHLRMSGDLALEPGDTPVGKYDRLLLNLADGSRLAFSDTRKFGRAWLVRDAAGLLGHLGPEPLGEDYRAEDLYAGLQKRARQIKPLLMEQTFLAGMGNIYTDEALHQAMIHPERAANSLSWAEAQRLWSAIRAVLEEGIRRNGSSIDWVYRGGDFQNYFQVYQRTGEPCYRCGTPVERIVVGQRGTHFCPKCQKA
jgi:formamidopyrimidine-DNA glycosylase